MHMDVRKRLTNTFILLLCLVMCVILFADNHVQAAASPAPYVYGSSRAEETPVYSPVPSTSPSSTPAITPSTKRTLSPRLNVNSLSLVKKKKYTLRVYNTDPKYRITYRSSNSRIVSIYKANSRSCKIRAKKSGTATITINIRHSSTLIATLTCSVTVGPPAVSVKFKKSNIRLIIGTNRRISAIVKPGNTKENPRYQSDNPDIAKVSSNGTVSVLMPGVTVISATIASGKSASYQLTALNADGTEPSPSPSPTPTSTSPSTSSYYYEYTR